MSPTADEQSFDESWERKIYAQSKHLNRYPFGELVGLFFNSLKFLETGAKSPSDTKLVELGSGTGNNLWFFAREGFDTTGIDGSRSAILEAKKLLEDWKTPQVQLVQGDLIRTEFSDSSFDILIDRAATCCSDSQEIRKIWKEAYRIMKPGGILLSFQYSEHHPEFKKAKSDSGYATQVDEFCYRDFKSGPFQDLGKIHFMPEDAIRDVFNDFRIRRIHHQESRVCFSEEIQDTTAQSSQWVITAQKQKDV